MSYDRAITVFSPDGHLFQVEYAIEAVRQGTTAVAIRAQDVVILAVERKSTAKLQEARTVRKIVKVDSHLALAFAGLTADARVLVNKARIESQSYRLTVEDACSVEYMARHIAKIQQKYTQRGGRRPFGISILLAGHDRDGQPHLYQTDPAGTNHEWIANAIGRNSKNVVEYLEKHMKVDEVESTTITTGVTGTTTTTSTQASSATALSESAALHLIISALLEVVESGGKNIEVGIMRRGEGLVMMDQEKVDELSKQISAEKEKEKEQREEKKEQ